MNFEEHISKTPTYHGDHFQLDEHIFKESILFQHQNTRRLPEKTWANLTLTDFQAAIDAGADLILIGTGKKQHFITPEMTVKLVAQGIGVECMNTAAACRTLMLLHSEGRKVWAWLFL